MVMLTLASLNTSFNSYSSNNTHIHTHNWPLQPFSQDYDLASHTIHVVCINFTHKWRDLQFHIDSKRQIFWESFSLQVYLRSEFLPEIYGEKISEEIFFYISFWCLTWDTKPHFTCTKPAHYLLDLIGFELWPNV